MKSSVLRLSAFLLLATLSACSSTPQVRYAPARWVQDNDRTPIKQPPSRQEYSVADAVQNQMFYQLERLVDAPLRVERGLHALGFPSLEEAHNTNNFDEVADSTWFTNRVGRRTMTPGEVRNFGHGKGPNPRGPWTIIKAKHSGISPGFFIEDGEGAKYLLKFDPVDNPELSSGAEVISTRILYAVGYNVPETYIVTFSPSILRISEKLSGKNESDRDFLNEKRLEEIFRRLSPGSDGRYRTLASRFIEGKILGPRPLRGKRRGDANDRIPHEHRRELRGYRWFSALIANSDTREANSLDTFIRTGPGEKGYVKHYMLDFSSTLGSRGTRPRSKTHLDDYYFNYGEVSASAATLGGYRPKWEQIEDPEIESVGLFESKSFKPQHWRPNYPIPPFQNATDRDGFWAAKIMARLTGEQIAGIVKEARYSDPRAESHVTRTLIERRNKIRDHWFSVMNPLDNFQLTQETDGVRVSFDDLAVQSGMRPAGSALYRFRLIHETTGQELLPWTEVAGNEFKIPRSALEPLPAGKPYLLQIQSKGKDRKFFGPNIDLVIQRQGQRDDEIRLLGLHRR
jgi:hypothetical protein